MDHNGTYRAGGGWQAGDASETQYIKGAGKKCSNSLDLLIETVMSGECVGRLGESATSNIIDFANAWNTQTAYYHCYTEHFRSKKRMEIWKLMHSRVLEF